MRHGNHRCAYSRLTKGNTSPSKLPELHIQKNQTPHFELIGLIGIFHSSRPFRADIDLKRDSPIGHGRVICFSVYCGPQHNFGGGPRVFADLMLGEPGILEVFRPYFEDVRIKKVRDFDSD